jgi:hypothetical protein
MKQVILDLLEAAYAWRSADLADAFAIAGLGGADPEKATSDLWEATTVLRIAIDKAVKEAS